ncbi:MAG: GTPase ObgE [Candidatus Makaraimicrobium thalassicum]|nr:MAG: GTPase ObgE [Candidatus Omnitrophota bacterium]
MLIDHAKIYVSGGSGGNGCQSLHKDLFHRKGVPDGGDGGDGGGVIIESNSNLHTLLDFRYNPHHRAGNGRHGGSNKKFGKRGKDHLAKVPVGTIIRDAENNLVVRDLARPGERVLVAKGGAGGKGNAKLRIATPGEMGESKVLLLELKLMADAGIVGFPNAGKSTLVSRISKAHSKIAPYPFTTRAPMLGVVKFYDETFVVADMPGLIEGAHAGRGLGDRFLRHIERTTVLVHVVDIVPVDGSDPAENYFKLEKELELYGGDVSGKPRVIAANKMDMPGAAEGLKKFTRIIEKTVWPISALNGKGLAELVGAIYGEIEDVRKQAEENNGQGRDEGPYGPAEQDRPERH